ncbi:hypothetical protein CAPTEDRAFT_200625 [Capitella teleta]|uniref:Caspase family p10 domain-containing protein n=1 Tax=Capitella teleta TaxID=283909 RepID=R7TBL3_CAPTE|nr:hypothetical protein CAPTEDRAFT_200625 [Capitella teleta]|eukprot:ELT88877.1 hypothetical protein CAPTEDRAFT_200625 [Capitella teleta]
MDVISNILLSLCFLIILTFQSERVASGSDERDGASQHDGPLVTELQRGVTDLNLDEPDAQPTEPTENEKLHRIVVTSTALGDTAWRQSDLGSPFIRAIVAVFNHFAHLEHLEDMISMVTDVMLQWGKKHDKTQICEKTRATLTKKLYFFP